MADLLTQEQIKMYKEAFNVFDKNGTGTISTKELGVIMRTLKQNPTEEELAELIAEVDQDGNGEIDFNEFLLMMAKRTKDSDMLDKALEAFRVFDRQNKGFLSVNELRNILQNVGEKLSPAEVEELLADIEEVNGGNELDYKSFLSNIFSNL
jgi:calmodulin